MTTVRSFQVEIDAIHDAEVLKQREHALALQKAQREKIAIKKDRIVAASKLENDAAAAAPVDPVPDVDEDESLQDLEVLLRAPASDESMADLKGHLGPRLLRSHGELIVSFGRARDSTKHYQSEGTLSEEEVGTVGENVEGGEKGLDLLRTRLGEAMKEMGGEMVELVRETTPSPHGSYMLRLIPTSIEQIIEVRLAVVGNVDAGKSSMLGVLTRGVLDDGRGKARVNLFRHKHEIESGRTSSVGMEILGFSPRGEPVIPESHAVPSASNDETGFVGSSVGTARREKLSWEAICSRSAKVISFLDLAGHERYLKTTIFGMTGCSPDYVILMVGGNAGLIGMSKEHLAVALALSVPVIVCITKIDMTPPQILEATKKQLVKILRSPGCRKTPVFVSSERDSVELAQCFVKDRLCPVFEISNVTGEGLPLLRSFLNVLPTSQSGDKFEVDAPLEYSISDVYSVPFVGTVTNGVLLSGKVKAGDTVLLGPDSLGHFVTTAVKSIQRKRSPVGSAEAGQSVSFALKRVRRSAVRKGMVIVAKTEELPKAVKRFEGQILILYHNTTIQPGYQAVLHSGAIRQTARIVSMDHPKGILRTGDRATVVFEFVGSPEFIREGAKLLFREGKCKGLGVVTKVL